MHFRLTSSTVDCGRERTRSLNPCRRHSPTSPWPPCTQSSRCVVGREISPQQTNILSDALTLYLRDNQFLAFWRRLHPRATSGAKSSSWRTRKTWMRSCATKTNTLPQSTPNSCPSLPRPLLQSSTRFTTPSVSQGCEGIAWQQRARPGVGVASQWVGCLVALVPPAGGARISCESR